jgi:hypothetical protein
VLAAKAVVFAALLLVVTEVVAFCSFFVGSAILHAHVQVTLSGSGGDWRAGSTPPSAASSATAASAGSRRVGLTEGFRDRGQFGLNSDQYWP